MVLCISDITWPDGSDQDAGTRASVMPQLEVTDGWYRLRADVDDSMARAMHRGTLRVGMKILVAGARVRCT
jgi:breast cancer 2 susceptibility protein